MRMALFRCLVAWLAAFAGTDFAFITCAAECHPYEWSYHYGKDVCHPLDVNALIAAKPVEGGCVVIPPGRWECAPVKLKSNIELHLSAGSELVFTDDVTKCLPAVLTSYEGIECYGYSPLIYAYGATNIAITGCGLIRPRMGRWEGWRWADDETRESRRILNEEWGDKDMPLKNRDLTALPGSKARPQFIGLNSCKGIRLEGFVLQDSPFWCIHLLNCENVVARGLTVSGFLNNNDGIDVECSRNVLIENCSFDQGDDVIVLKSGKDRDGRRRAIPTENVTVRRCRAGAGHGLLVIGSECSGGVRNVLLEDCLVDGSVYSVLKVKTSCKRGGYVENVRLRRVRAKSILDSVVSIVTDYSINPSGVRAEIVLTPIKDISVEDVEVAVARRRCDVRGDARRPIEGLFLRNIVVGEYEQDDRVENAKIVKEDMRDVR